MRWQVEDRGFETPCHIWTMGVDSEGYPTWRRKGRSRRAHRTIYEDAIGRLLPAHVHVHHRCEHKLCVNPDHMVDLSGRDHLRTHRLGKPQVGGASGERGPNLVVPWRARAAAEIQTGGST